MRVCCPPHAVIKIVRRKQLLWRPLFPFPRPFTSTVSTRYPSLITRIQSDVPPYEPQAQPNLRAKDVAVVGGGITGLTAAYNLTKALPDANITLFERTEKLGGWLDSEIVPVDGGEVLFEWGPRTLRNAGMGAGRYTAQLVGETQEARSLVLMLFYR
jgi:NAD(P)-binding Rossmann-like domain